MWEESIPAFPLAENVLLYFGRPAIWREQFDWNGCGTRSPDHAECRFYVAIRRVAFKFRAGSYAFERISAEHSAVLYR